VIAFSSVSKQYGGQLLFVDASFQINPGEKVGLVGPNGAGKSTVFRMIVGEEQPDDGAIERPKKLTLGYFRQDVGELRGRSILAETCAGAGEVAELAIELAALTAKMEDPGDDLEQVVERDQPDQHAIGVDHRNAPHALAAHAAQQVDDGVALARGHEVGTHRILDSHQAGVEILGDDAGDDVAIGQHAHHDPARLGLVDHHQGSDMVLAHQPRGIVHRRALVGEGDRARADVAGSQTCSHTVLL
jgi:hypothetical protein